MKKIKQLIYAAALIGCAVSCAKEDRTTVVYGKITDDVNQPVEGVEIKLFGEKGITSSISTLLKATYTDKKGEYTITYEVSTDFHSGKIHIYPSSDKYDINTGTLYFNGQETKECCPLEIGKKNQYDLVLVKK
jgi:hypothetical protein